MSKFALQHPPEHQAASFTKGAEQQQWQEKEDQNEERAVLRPVFSFPGPGRRKDQQERFKYRPKEHQQRVCHAEVSANPTSDLRALCSRRSVRKDARTLQTD